MRSFSRIIVLVGIAAPDLACGGEDDAAKSGPEVTCPATPPTFAQVTAFGVCINCHSSSKTGADRNGAATNVNFDLYASAKQSAALAVHEVKEGLMPPPPPDSPYTLTAEQKDTLFKWEACGTPQ